MEPPIGGFYADRETHGKSAKADGTTSSQRLRRPSANVRAPNVGSVDFESGYGMEGNGAGLTGQNPQANEAVVEIYNDHSPRTYTDLSAVRFDTQYKTTPTSAILNCGVYFDPEFRFRLSDSEVSVLRNGSELPRSVVSILLVLFSIQAKNAERPQTVLVVLDEFTVYPPRAVFGVVQPVIDYVLIPIFSSTNACHWTLAVWQRSTTTITFYDPLQPQIDVGAEHVNEIGRLHDTVQNCGYSVGPIVLRKVGNIVLKPTQVPRTGFLSLSGSARRPLCTFYEMIPG
ncbi:hypothetical protein AAVH_34196 [Aphelenchoides avenae]|nr:hypothetical protein AAVH_34196 [Aphelenchus avenae]